MNTLRHVREQGYAFRIDSYPGENSRGGTLRAIARPLLHRGASIGALVILWPRDFLSLAHFAAIHLKALQETADCINADLDRMNPSPTGATRTRGRRVPGTALHR